MAIRQAYKANRTTTVILYTYRERWLYAADRLRRQQPEGAVKLAESAA
ncbi:hypothetical protein [Intestinibacillus sp. Marseille-P6563]|nr:hypothetical protein [Intestinibacillus sp. Marseille-P6563]